MRLACSRRIENHQLLKMLKTILSFVILILALNRQLVYSTGTYKDVTHYQYVVEWTPTWCKYPPGGAVCESGVPAIFVMHGIWPANASGDPVPYCADKTVSNAEMKSFQAKLTVSWPSIVQGRSPFAFWGHEYKTHGTCMEKWSGWNYLTFADRVSRDNNMTKILDAGGISKSDVTKYSKSDIVKAVQTKVGAGFNIYLSCKKVNQSLYYLRELAVCIKKKKNPEYLNNYDFQSCPQSADPNRIDCGGNDPEAKDIMLPIKI